MLTPTWIDEVHRFWFQELRPDDWFRTDKVTDEKIRLRFSDLYEALAHATPVASSPRQAVAAVIVLDQFPRNLFRGKPQAYATDAAALALAKSAVNAGFIRQLGVHERHVLYMPFQHSEDRAIQRQSLALFQDLGVPEFLKYAEHHQSIIDRFGRFPHRNSILGRTSTAEEIEFLKTQRPFN